MATIDSDNILGLFEFKQIQLSEASPNELLDMELLFIAPKDWDFQKRLDAVLQIKELENLSEARKPVDAPVCCAMTPKY